MVNQQLCYMRWDSQNIAFTVTKSNEEETVRINGTPYFVEHVPKSPCISFDFTALQSKMIITSESKLKIDLLL